MQNSSTLPTHPTLMHPRTGAPLAAVYVSPKTGRVRWPILGGDGSGGDGGEGAGDGGQSGNGDGGTSNNSPAYTPPASQADLDRIIEQRLARERGKYADYDDLKARAERLDALELEMSTDLDRATRQAVDDGYSSAMAAAVPRIVRAEFKAEAKGVLSDEQLDALLEDVDLTAYADINGDPDVDRIKAKIEKFAPPQGTRGTNYVRPPVSFGQGNQQQSQAKPGDQGRAQAAKRFGKQTQ